MGNSPADISSTLQITKVSAGSVAANLNIVPFIDTIITINNSFIKEPEQVKQEFSKWKEKAIKLTLLNLFTMKNREIILPKCQKNEILGISVKLNEFEPFCLNCCITKVDQDSALRNVHPDEDHIIGIEGIFIPDEALFFHKLYEHRGRTLILYVYNRPTHTVRPVSVHLNTDPESPLGCEFAMGLLFTVSEENIKMVFEQTLFSKERKKRLEEMESEKISREMENEKKVKEIENEKQREMVENEKQSEAVENEKGAKEMNERNIPEKINEESNQSNQSKKETNQNDTTTRFIQKDSNKNGNNSNKPIINSTTRTKSENKHGERSKDAKYDFNQQLNQSKENYTEHKERDDIVENYNKIEHSTVQLKKETEDGGQQSEQEKEQNMSTSNQDSLWLLEQTCLARERKKNSAKQDFYSENIAQSPKEKEKGGKHTEKKVETSTETDYVYDLKLNINSEPVKSNEKESIHKDSKDSRISELFQKDFPISEPEELQSPKEFSKTNNSSKNTTADHFLREQQSLKKDILLLRESMDYQTLTEEYPSPCTIENISVKKEEQKDDSLTENSSLYEERPKKRYSKKEISTLKESLEPQSVNEKSPQLKESSDYPKKISSESDDLTDNLLIEKTRLLHTSSDSSFQELESRLEKSKNYQTEEEVEFLKQLKSDTQISELFRGGTDKGKINDLLSQKLNIFTTQVNQTELKPISRLTDPNQISGLENVDNSGQPDQPNNSGKSKEQDRFNSKYQSEKGSKKTYQPNLDEQKKLKGFFEQDADFDVESLEVAAEYIPIHSHSEPLSLRQNHLHSSERSVSDSNFDDCTETVMEDGNSLIWQDGSGHDLVMEKELDKK